MSTFRFFRELALVSVFSILAHAADEPRFGRGTAAAHFSVDTSPLERGPTDHRASYADVLKIVTPKVVSVFPARLTKPGEAAEDELLKRFFGAKKDKPGDD